MMMMKTDIRYNKIMFFAKILTMPKIEVITWQVAMFV